MARSYYAKCNDAGKGNRRAGHARRLEQMILTCAAGQNTEAHRYTREDVRACFRESGAITRYEIAQAIAAHVPAMSHRLPPMKKLWESEDGRMGLFDAASLALTYFCHGPASSGANVPADADSGGQPA